MRIVVAHSAYRSSTPSGENVAVEAELRLLREAGHDVIPFVHSSDALLSLGAVGQAVGAAGAVWNPRARQDLERLLARTRPDILHVHNLFPRLSASVLGARRPARTALVCTFHNYRLFCLNGLALRGGEPCEACLRARSPLPGITAGCYRGSRLASLPAGAALAFQRATRAFGNLDAGICQTGFQRSKLLQTGLLDERTLHVRPQPVTTPEGAWDWSHRPQRVTFVGRLSGEKGVDVLVEAWRRWGDGAPELLIVGEGPLRVPLERQARGLHLRFVGRLERPAVQEALANSRLVVIPSRAFETLSLTALEAMASGTPLAVTNHGALAEVVAPGIHGVHFPPGQAGALLDVVREVWSQPDVLARMSRACRERHADQYSPPVGTARLMEIYAAAHEHRERTRPLR